MYPKDPVQLRLLAIILTVVVIVLIFLSVGFIIFIAVQSTIDEPVTETTVTSAELPPWPLPSSSQMGSYAKAAVATDHGRCSEIGRDVLIHGGNAVDAAIAALMCVGVVSPQSSGVGGGFIMTIYNRTTKSCHIIDAREVAPKASNENMYANLPTSSLYGYMSIAVPGQIKGLFEAKQKYGNSETTWKSLLDPTADLCTKGFPVSPILAQMIRDAEDTIRKTNTVKNVFLKDGLPYQAGDIIKFPVLGETIRKLANDSDPVNLFYNGKMMEDMVKEIKAGRIITEEDFRNYTVKMGEERPVIKTALKDHLVICAPPPPSSGSVTSAVLKILDGYNLSPENLKTVDDNVEVYHRLIEALKFGYAAREEMGDMDFVPTALDLARNITSDWYGDYIRSKISKNSLNEEDYRGKAFLNHRGGTSHVSVVDKNGNAVSVTSTINTRFGSFMRSESTGILWNNEMDDFSQPNKSNAFNFRPTLNNFIKPGKRPLSSMSPLIVYNEITGDVKALAGASGGSAIITATLQILLRVVYFNQTIKEALDSPRLHNQLQPYWTKYEIDFPNVYVKGLKARGQNMSIMGNEINGMIMRTSMNFGNGILRVSANQLDACSDFRRSTGYPAGY